MNFKSLIILKRFPDSSLIQILFNTRNFHKVHFSNFSNFFSTNFFQTKYILFRLITLLGIFEEENDVSNFCYFVSGLNLFLIIYEMYFILQVIQIFSSLSKEFALTLMLNCKIM